MPPLAHSARPKLGVPMQEYADHIRAVVRMGCARAHRVGIHAPRFASILESAVGHAGLWHDLGKLDSANQKVLATVSRERLPINHCDAGVAQLLLEVTENGHPALLVAAFLVYAHHIGLPGFAEQEVRANFFLRDEKLFENQQPVYQRTNGSIDELVRQHRITVPDVPVLVSEASDWQAPLLFRIALSCLVDADHADTANHYRDSPLFEDPPLRAAERLASLDEYVNGLGRNKTDERNRLRSEVYAACRNADTVASLLECDSPVGTGKTTAVMAHLLRASMDKGLRRIFVVLPYTNIITQSVEVYRKSLLLPGEDPEMIVVPHHHKAQFQSVDSRKFTALWHAPIVVTTAVQFFETLAEHHPSGLRKLHQLPGSAIFIDESHAAVPTKLWPRTWDWLKQLTRDWGCHVVFGSGSLNRVWQIPEVDVDQPVLPKLVHPDTDLATAAAELERVTFHTVDHPQTLSQFAAWATKIPGPRLVIVNTVQTAAALARLIAEKNGRCRVEHISTALCPSDRDKTLNVVKARLDPSRKDGDWTLVATSCVEAGVDISFRVGFRERCGLTSLLQTAGRVNRSNEFNQADVWDFRLSTGELVAHNPSVRDSAEILGRLFAANKVSPASCTESLRQEIFQQYSADLHKRLATAEINMDFPTVADLYKVIDQDTVTAVVEAQLIARLQNGDRVGWQDIQQGSVSMYFSKSEKFKLPVAEFRAFPDLYRWNLDYDGFLGYMAGALQWLDGEQATNTCVFIV